MKDPENTKDPAKRNGFRAEAVVADVLTRAGCAFARESRRGYSVFGTRLCGGVGFGKTWLGEFWSVAARWRAVRFGEAR